MIHAKFLVYAVYLIVQKINNIMHVYTERKFANMRAKNTIQFVKYERENIKIMRIYLLNTLQMIIDLNLHFDYC